jgi:hypothetical protein
MTGRAGEPLRVMLKLLESVESVSVGPLSLVIVIRPPRFDATCLAAFTKPTRDKARRGLPTTRSKADMALGFRRRNLTRLFILISAVVLIRLGTSSKSASSREKSQEIKSHGVLDFVHGSESALDARRHSFLQSRVGRDEREDLMSDIVRNGVDDYWERFQKP